MAVNKVLWRNDRGGFSSHTHESPPIARGADFFLDAREYALKVFRRSSDVRAIEFYSGCGRAESTNSLFLIGRGEVVAGND